MHSNEDPAQPKAKEEVALRGPTWAPEGERENLCFAYLAGVSAKFVKMPMLKDKKIMLFV